ncbi:MAG: Rieske 2Fe-2S domain-containing protein [bacterium]
MNFYPLEKRSLLKTGYRKAFDIEGRSLLLIVHRDQPFLVENRCGHFGYPLDEGVIEGDAIVCPQHGISFDLLTGSIANRPYENADPIMTFPLVEQGGMIGVMLGK